MPNAMNWLRRHYYHVACGILGLGVAMALCGWIASMATRNDTRGIRPIKKRG